MGESPLIVCCKSSAEARVRVEHRQERETQPDFFRRGNDAPRKLRWIRIRFALRVMMNVMELSDSRVTGLRHFQIRLCGDRSEYVHVDTAKKSVHRFAPGPERVVARTCRASR